MTRRNDRLNAVALAAAIICLLPLHLLTLRGTARAEPQGGGCGDSLSSLEQLNGNIGMDAGMAGRAQSLAENALQNGRPPTPTEVQQLAEDSMDSLNAAGDQLDQLSNHIGRRLKSGTQQSRGWTRGVNDMRVARNNLRGTIQRNPGFARPQNLGSLSATGVGPRVVYEAAATYQHSVESLGQIAMDGDFHDMGKGMSAVLDGARDTPPPPNPSPDPWEEWLRRLRAQQALSRNAARGLSSAQALQAQRFQQARQLATQMQEAVQQATDMANQLGQLLGPCASANQSNNNSNNQRGTEARQPAQATPAAGTQAAAAAASSGGGMGAGTAAMLGLAVAGGAGYYAYTQLNPADTCGEVPDVTSNLNACSFGNCGACAAAIDELDSFCICAEGKGETPAGICGDLRRAANDLRRACAPAPRPSVLQSPLAR